MEGASKWAVHGVLVFTQLTFGISYILNKVALNNGMNKFVFSVYRDLVAIVVLAPLAFFIERRKRTPLTLKLVGLIFLLGFIGIFSAQILMLTGLSLTSSGFTSIVQNAIPVFAFVIAIIFRLEEIRYRRRDGQAKLLGVVSCISGAIVASFFKGPAVLGGEPASLQPILHSLGQQLTKSMNISVSSWQLGALCLFANTVCMATYINLQAPILALFPAPFSLTALSYVFGAIVLASVGALTVSDSSSWRLTKPMDAVAFIYAGSISSGMNFGLQTWCVQKAGPFLVISYFPLQAIASTLLSFIFLNDSLFLGSVVGGLLIISGLYLVTWGQVQQKRLDDTGSLVTAQSNTTTTEPLLR